MKKKSLIILIGIQFFLCFMFFINFFIINIKDMYIISSFLTLVMVSVVACLGYEKNRQRLKKDALLNAFIYASLLQVILYLSGLFFGFLSSGYSLDPAIMLKNIFPEVLFIVSMEVLRYTINQKGRDSKAILVISCITFIIIEALVRGSLYNFSDKKNIVELVCLVVFPLISKNVFLTYNTTNFGFESSILYRFIMELLIYIIPIVPDVGDYLNAITYFLYPLIVFYVTKNTMGKRLPYEEVVYKKASKIPFIILGVFIIVIVSLNSSFAPFYVLAIGSGSMERTISKGDAVIVKRVKEENIHTLDVGDILVYKHQSKVIVHRIHEIECDEDLIKIITKGDNNESIDNWYVNNKEIIGKVILKIKYAGIPTIWLNDLLN